MSSTPTASKSTPVDPKHHHELHSAATHLLSDLLAGTEEAVSLTAKAARNQLSDAFFELSETGWGPALDTYENNYEQYYHDHLEAEIKIITENNPSASTDLESPDGQKNITSVTLAGARPHELPPFGELSTVSHTDVPKSTADFQVLDNVGRDKADILAKNGITTWQDVTDIGTDHLTDYKMIGPQTAEDLVAEAQSYISVESSLLEDSLNRVANIPTDDNRQAVSHSLDEISQPPGIPIPADNKNLHGWHYLEDIDHPGVPNDPGPVKERTLPTSKTDYEEVCTQLAKGNNVMLVGKPGTGKNTLFKKAFATTNRPLLTIPLDNDILSQELLGNFTIDDDGNEIVFEYGPVPQIMRNGGGICFDEINAAPQSVVKLLHKLLEDDTPHVYVKGKDEVIEAHPEFYACATINPDDAGTEPMASALSSRFVPIIIDSLSIPQEVDLLDGDVNATRTVVPRDRLEQLVKSAHTIRDRSENGSLPYINYRDLKHVCDLADNDGDLRGAFRMVIKGKDMAGVGSGRLSTGNSEALKDLIQL